MGEVGRVVARWAVLAVASVGCGWQGPATIHLKDGTLVRCPNILVTEASVTCEGLEGRAHVYPVAEIAQVTPQSN